MDEKSIAVATVVKAVDQARSLEPLSGSIEQPSVETDITAVHITSQNEQVVWYFSAVVVTHPNLILLFFYFFYFFTTDSTKILIGQHNRIYLPIFPSIISSLPTFSNIKYFTFRQQFRDFFPRVHRYHVRKSKRIQSQL